MHDFSCSDPDEMYFDLMRNTSRYYKENAKGVQQVSSVSEEIRIENSIRIAQNLIAEGDIPLETIARVCGLPLDRVRELAEKKTA